MHPAHFIQRALEITGTQVAALIGVFLFFSVLLHLFERMTTRMLVNAFGWPGVLWTGWLGAPLHELAHVLGCKLFMHKVQEVNFFAPDPKSGLLGYVIHTYNRKNPWALAGNFFVGAAPLFMGVAALFGLLHLLVPNAEAVVAAVQKQAPVFSIHAGPWLQLRDFGALSWQMFQALFNRHNIRTYPFWIFIYLSLCVSAHMGPSLPDMKGVGLGFAVMAGALLIVNGIVLGTGHDLTPHVLALGAHLAPAVTFFVLAALLSLMGTVVTFCLCTVRKLV